MLIKHLESTATGSTHYQFNAKGKKIVLKILLDVCKDGKSAEGATFRANK